MNFRRRLAARSSSTSRCYRTCVSPARSTVKCPTLDELTSLQEACTAAGLNTYLIRDAGHTEIEPGSRTVLAVGPAPASALDPITRHLKPY